MDTRHRKKAGKGFKDISHYFLSAAEADASSHAAGAAGHPAEEVPPMLSDGTKASMRRSLQPMRRKENCASCAHLIARSGQPFQCRIYCTEHARYKVPPKETIEIDQGHTCPYFMRVTSGQIEEILRSHRSTLSSQKVREHPHQTEERITREKIITVQPYGGMTAEEALREELLRYVVDGYSIIDATVVLTENSSEGTHSSTSVSRIRLRVREDA